MSLQVLSSDNPKYGYNAATGKYEDLMAAGIIDPTKVNSTYQVLFLSISVYTYSRLLEVCLCSPHVT